MGDVMAELTASRNIGELLDPDVEDDECQPPASKRIKLDEKDEYDEYSLEQRLQGILSCTVCYDLPSLSFYQCANGHLLCSSCLSCLVAESRLQKTKALCPICSCEVSQSLCRRNLVVEKAISEMPISCPFCERLLPRSGLSFHKRDQCQERPAQCKYTCIGCDWTGPARSLAEHEAVCTLPSMSGHELFESVLQREQWKLQEVRVYKRLLDLLSYENVEFVDFRLLPYLAIAVDDSTPAPSYTTNPFAAHGLNWSVHACIVNVAQDNTLGSIRRMLKYKIVLQTKPRNPVLLSYVILKGPYGAIELNPTMYEFQFAENAMETPYHDIPCCDQLEGNALVASRSIKLRLALIQAGFIPSLGEGSARRIVFSRRTVLSLSSALSAAVDVEES